MDQEAQYPEDIPMEEEEYDHVTVAPPVESALGKYLREYRLLNSLLVSLLSVTIFLVVMWGLIIYVAGGGEGSSDFADAGVAPTQQKQKQQKQNAA